MVKVEDVFPLEVVVFLVVLLCAWGANGCRPLFPDFGMECFVVGGGLMLACGLLFAIFFAEVGDCNQKKRGKL